MRACVYTLIIFFFWSVDSAIGCEEGAIRVLPCSVCFCIRGETKCSPGACLDINETRPSPPPRKICAKVRCLLPEARPRSLRQHRGTFRVRHRDGPVPEDRLRRLWRQQ
ncbi:uncharacterized protein LOC143032008 isoform X2 [Oratosquilla oratoria]|uniref:uncharacterized protein LOC143032008 isoform X2 n=1 Tax=Oratosquilla oratoria TaxID=337810 RepID=UPI003F76BB87